MKKPKILDLFCCAGGASKGYSDGGFDVVGVDITPQPRYPYEFHCADWKDFLDAHWHEFDVLHASPPCQGYSCTKSIRGSQAPLLISEVRERFLKTGKPYVIENVKGAKKHMVNPITLRGNQFGLKVIRDRLFEVNPFILSSPLTPVEGTANADGYSSFSNADYICVAGHIFNLSDAKQAMGIDWMNKREITQAIPPAYTKWIAQQLISILSFQKNVA